MPPWPQNNSHASEKRRVIVVEFRQDLFHYSFAEEHSLGTDPEFLAITVDGRHFAVVQIYDLPVTTHKGFLLLLQVFRIDS